MIKLKADNIFDLYWFIGKVEDRNDPMELGRVRVRVYGLHTPDKVKDQFKGIPTDELPWSQPINGVQSASMNGIGQSPSNMTENTMVFGFFLDGRLSQDPFVLGTLAGIPVDAANPSQGFNDPKGVYPKYLNESDVSRLARTAYMSHPGLARKFDSLVKQIPTSADNIATTGNKGSADVKGEKWDEPAPANAPRYPYNHVRESESGHIEEYDDTPGAERMHWMHGPTGTYEEWRPDGSVSAKTNGDETVIIIGTKRLMVSGNQQITILGNAKLLVQGNVEEQVNGNVTRLVKGNVSEKIEGNFSRDILGESFTNTQGNVVQRDGSNRTDFTAINKTTTVGANNSETINGKNAVTVLGDWSCTSGSNYTHVTNGNHNQLIGGNNSISVKTAYGLACANFSVGVNGPATIDAIGAATIMGSRIDLN